MARRAASLGLGLSLGPLLSLAACGDASSPATPSPRRGADKEAAFGDPTLLPTREGERARLEVAWAREIEQAIAMLPEITGARVDVERPRRGEDRPARVLAVVEAEAESESLRPSVETIAQTIVGPTAVVEIVVAVAPEPTPPSSPGWSWPLLLGLLGLGLSAGIAIERARGLYGARTIRPSR